MLKIPAKVLLKYYKSEKLFGEITNIGMNEEISVGNLLNMIVQILDADIRLKTDGQRVRPENSEVERLLCNNKKIINNTGWKPDFNLRTGLIETIEFIKMNLNSYKTDIYNV